VARWSLGFLLVLLLGDLFRVFTEQEPALDVVGHARFRPDPPPRRHHDDDKCSQTGDPDQDGHPLIGFQGEVHHHSARLAPCILTSAYPHTAFSERRADGARSPRAPGRIRTHPGSVLSRLSLAAAVPVRAL